MKKAIIIRFCEIHLKGKNRGYFEKMLIENIKRSLSGIEHDFTVCHCRYMVENFSEYDYDLIVDKLTKIAGIHSISPVTVCESNIESITTAVLDLMKDKEGTFKINTNRADKNFPMLSTEISPYIGGQILKRYAPRLKVKIKDADYILFANTLTRADIQIYHIGISFRCVCILPQTVNLCATENCQ